MSRVANKPVSLPKGVDFKQQGQMVTIKGGNGSLELDVNTLVSVQQQDDQLLVSVAEESQDAWAMAGTTRSLLDSMVIGVTEGFSKTLQLNGVGYRAKASGKTLNLSLGFSHPVDYSLPEGVSAETPNQTEIIIKGANKQQVGQVAAEIRAFRPPEPYKGKGVRYADEYVRRKEAKKK